MLPEPGTIPATIQWTYSPRTASGSSTTSASSPAPAGADHAKGGRDVGPLTAVLHRDRRAPGERETGDRQFVCYKRCGSRADGRHFRRECRHLSTATVTTVAVLANMASPLRSTPCPRRATGGLHPLRCRRRSQVINIWPPAPHIPHKRDADSPATDPLHTTVPSRGLEASRNGDSPRSRQRPQLPRYRPRRLRGDERPSGMGLRPLPVDQTPPKDPNDSDAATE